MSRLFTSLLRRAPRLTKGTASNFINSSALRTCCTIPFPRVQHPAPDFKGVAVHNNDFKEIKLSDYKGKYVVLVFYPLDFTFVCPTELVALDKRIKEFQEIGSEVIGISTDSQYSHLAWMNLNREQGGIGQLRYPLLSDINKTISKAYNVLIEDQGIALRGLFIIDPNGILRVMSINDLPIGRSVDETLRLIKALQFVEKHGEVCPANWQEGEKTIKPNPKESKDFFKTFN